MIRYGVNRQGYIGSHLSLLQLTRPTALHSVLCTCLVSHCIPHQQYSRTAGAIMSVSAIS